MRPDFPLGARYVDETGVELEAVSLEGNGADTWWGVLEPVEHAPGVPPEVRVRLGDEFTMRRIR